MSTGDHEFKPKLGRIRSAGDANAKTHVEKLLRAASGRRGKQRVSAAPKPAGYSARYQRRSIVKTRIVKMAGTGAAKQRAHLRYIERDAAREKSGEKERGGVLYDRTSDDADRDAFIERGEDDRHQFRIIVAPEDGACLESLKPLTRDLMASMERELDTRLDWIAADHYDTGRPHTHIVIRGERDDGKDLVIPKRVIAHGMRERVNELLSIELGPVTELDLQRRAEREVGKERWTSLDRELKSFARDSFVTVDKDARNLKARLHILRLDKLQRLGLAENLGKRQWRLDTEIESKLRDLGERGDIIKAMNKELRSRGDGRVAGAESIFDSVNDERNVTGRVISVGRHGDFHERAFTMIDGIDGAVHHVDLGDADHVDEITHGAVVEISGRGDGVKKSDPVIEAVARQNDGVYSPMRHEKYDDKASREFIRSHVRRLEALRRLGVVDRSPDGSWAIPGDYLARVRLAQKSQLKTRPVDVRELTTWSLEKQMRVVGTTWIDRETKEYGNSRLSDDGFGGEVQTAVEKRRHFLKARGLDGASFERLQELELSSEGKRLIREFGKPVASAPKSGKVEGHYVRDVELASGKFALLEKRRELTLVPWRRAMTRARGRNMVGVARNGRITWDWSKGRGR
ncbi:MAG: DUF3363 domain-containing protein [Marinicaulis sp.]|nr:DUF3363 domain-containing protein [Marinicaulis sp.]